MIGESTNTNQPQEPYDPDLSGKRMEDASKYLPKAEYGTKALEAYLANAGELIEQFESTNDAVWLKHKDAIEAFLQVIKNPISPASLELYKQILETKAREKIDPYPNANHVKVDMSSLPATNEGVPPAANRVQVDPTSYDFQKGGQE